MSSWKPSAADCASHHLFPSSSFTLTTGLWTLSSKCTWKIRHSSSSDLDLNQRGPHSCRRPRLKRWCAPFASSCYQGTCFVASDAAISFAKAAGIPTSKRKSCPASPLVRCQVPCSAGDECKSIAGHCTPFRNGVHELQRDGH